MKMPEDEPKNLRAPLIERNVRPWNSYWYWRDKQSGSMGSPVKCSVRLGMKVANLVSRPQNQDPPDCEGILDGWSGIEITELVHRPTLKRSIKAVKARAAGRQPEKSEAYYVWDRRDYLATVQQQIDDKDAATIKGGPYDRYVLVIHTGEFFLNRMTVNQFLQGARFSARLIITDVLVGLSYEPGFGLPTFALDLTRSS